MDRLVEERFKAEVPVRDLSGEIDNLLQQILNFEPKEQNYVLQSILNAHRKYWEKRVKEAKAQYTQEEQWANTAVFPFNREGNNISLDELANRS